MRFNCYDLAYAIGLSAAAPVWLVRPTARRKVLGALRQRMARGLPPCTDPSPSVLIHAVSVGEVNAVPALIAALRRRRNDLRFYVTTTTQTGGERARQLFADGSATTLPWPLDFTPAVRRLLDATRPSAVVLMELEVWPNFALHCARRGIPLIVANGRVTEPAMRRYRWAGPVGRRMFARVSGAGVQDDTYADRFARLGVPRDRIAVLGTMKFDAATLADRVTGDTELASTVGLRPGAEPIWVCGSTGPGEESIVLEAYRALRARHPGLRLVIVPRHPPRFDEAAGLVRAAGFAVLRRSMPGAVSGASGAPVVILGDTMGELRKFYSLADVVFVGRSLVDLGPRQHGSDMIEPAALGKPVVVGPFTGNFDMPMRLLRAAHAAVDVPAGDPGGLAAAVDRLLGDPESARAMGRRAQGVVRAAQGSTDRHAELIDRHLPQRSPPPG